MRILIIIALVLLGLWFLRGQGSISGNYYAAEGAQNAQGSVGGIR